MVQSQLASASSTPSPKPSNSEAFLCTNPLPFLPAPKCQITKEDSSGGLARPFLSALLSGTHFLLPFVVTRQLQGGKRWVHTVWSGPPPPGTPWGPPAAPSSNLSSRPTPPMASSLPVMVKTGSSSCSSFPGRAGSWSHCPKPHMFNPSKEEQTQFRPTIERKLRFSLEELPEAASGTQSLH